MRRNETPTSCVTVKVMYWRLRLAVSRRGGGPLGCRSKPGNGRCPALSRDRMQYETLFDDTSILVLLLGFVERRKKCCAVVLLIKELFLCC
jgi:hypothetical protein